jgi:hypothetical protein
MNRSEFIRNWTLVSENEQRVAVEAESIGPATFGKLMAGLLVSAKFV